MPAKMRPIRLVTQEGAPPEPSAVETRGGKYPDSVRQLAYEVWANEGGRRLKATVEALANEPYNETVPYKTLWEWFHAEQWDIRADREAWERRPATRARLEAMAESAALAAMSYVMQAANNPAKANKDMNGVAKLAFEAMGLTGSRSAGGVQVVVAANQANGEISDADRKRLAAKMEGDDDDEDGVHEGS